MPWTLRADPMGREFDDKLVVSFSVFLDDGRWSEVLGRREVHSLFRLETRVSIHEVVPLEFRYLGGLGACRDHGPGPG